MQKTIDFKEISNSAQGQWEYVLTSLGIDATYLTNKHKPCPACGGKDRFRFDNKRGTGSFICTHWNNGGGDGFGLICHYYNCDIKEAMRLVAGVFGMTEANPLPNIPTPPQQPIEPQADSIKKLTRLWDSAMPATQTNALISYLAARGVNPEKAAMLMGNLRFIESYDYWTQDLNEQWHPIGQFPLMLAKFEALDGSLMGLHRTYLNHSCTGKAHIVDPFTGRILDSKKMMARYPSSNKGASIHLLEPIDVLAVTEGIESAAAVFELTGLPVWACGNAGNMSKLQLPSNLKQIHIYADTDTNGVGMKNARQLQSKAISMGIDVSIFETGIVGMDILDLMVNAKRVGVPV